VALTDRKQVWRSLVGVSAGALAILAFVAAPGATAAEPGVHVDPGSPAGKEYAIPLDQARNDATPSGGGHSGARGSSPGSALFGQGIRPPASSSHSKGGSAGGGARGGSSTAAPVLGKSGERQRQAGVVALPAAASTGRVDTGLPLILAIAVLAAGCLGGLASRTVRRRRS